MVAATALLALTLAAQLPNPPFFSTLGYNCAQFGEWVVNVQTPVAAAGAATILVDVENLVLPDGPAFQPLTTGMPVAVLDGQAGEVVTPSQVVCAAGVCRVTALFARSHEGNFRLASADGGIQEAVNYATAHGGGVVVIGANVSGPVSVSSVLQGSVNTQIEDRRSGEVKLYGWNGDGYVANWGDSSAGVATANVGDIEVADQHCQTPGTLDQTCIQNAYNALPAIGGEVYIPGGMYLLNASIVQNPTKPAHFRCSPAATLTWTGATSGFGNIAGGSSIIGCHLVSSNPDSTFAVNGGYGAWQANTAYTAAADAIVPTVGNGNGLFYGPVTSCTTGLSEPTWPTVLGGEVSDGSCLWKALGQTAVTLRSDVFSGWGQQEVNTGGYNYGWVIVNCVFINGYNEGVLAGAGTEHVTVRNSFFHNLGSNAIDFGGGEYNLAEDNTIINVGTNASFGVDRDGIQMAAISGFDATGSTAAGNLIEQTGQTGVRFRSVNGQHADGETARDNTIIAPLLDCIIWDTSALTDPGNALDRDVAEDNRCTGPGRDGFFVSSTVVGDVSNAVIKGNIVEGAQAGGYDIYVGAQSQNAMVVANDSLSTAPPQPVFSAAASTVFHANQLAAATMSSSAGELTLSGGTATHVFIQPYLIAPACVAVDTTAVASVRIVATTTTVTVFGGGSDSVAWMCQEGAN